MIDSPQRPQQHIRAFLDPAESFTPEFEIRIPARVLPEITLRAPGRATDEVATGGAIAEMKLAGALQICRPLRELGLFCDGYPGLTPPTNTEPAKRAIPVSEPRRVGVATGSSTQLALVISSLPIPILIRLSPAPRAISFLFDEFLGFRFAVAPPQALY